MVSGEQVGVEGNFKGQQRDFVAHCFCLVTFLLKFHSPVSVREVTAKIITALKAMTWPYAKCHTHFPCPSPHRLARVQCSLCALLVSIAKSCVLKVCCCPPPPPNVFPSHTHLNFALRRFAVFRVRAFHTKKCKIRAKFTSNVELTWWWWWKGMGGRRGFLL